MIRTRLNLLEGKGHRLVCCCICLGWVMIFLSSLLLLVLCFAHIFAAMNVAGECTWGRGNRGGEKCRNSHSLGSSCICSTPSLNIPRHTWKWECFVCETQCSQGHAHHPCLSGIRDLETLARCGGSVRMRSTTEFCLSRAPFCFYF